MMTTGDIGRNDRALQFAGLQPMGSGAAAMAAFKSRQDIIATIPGGRDSLAYAQAYAGFRGARTEAFGQQTLTEFGFADVQLQGRRERQSLLPFSPGNIFATNLAMIQNNRQQIGRVNQQLGLGDLSEQERYSLLGQRESLLTATARGVAELSEGFENKLPALAAGRPDFFAKYNSLQGAAINLGRIGSPVRAYGAYGGGQRSAQEAVVSALGGDTVPHASMPYSRTGEVNNAPYLQEMIGLLRQIANQGGHAAQVGHNRPTDNFGAVQGAANKDISQQQQAAWNSH